LLSEYLQEIADSETAVTEWNAKKEEFELGPEDEQVDEEDDGTDGDGEASAKRRNYAQCLDDERKELGVSIKDHQDRLKVLNGNVKRSGSIKYAQSKGQDIGELQSELYLMQSEVEPIQRRIEELERLLEPYAEIKKQLQEARRRLREQRENLLKQLDEKVAAMNEDELATLVLQMLEDEFTDMLSEYVSANRRQMNSFIENLWDKYSVDLNSLEEQRDASAKLLRAFAEELSYVS
jgi:DNA repair exonuclease SbcCD ATPase subunit